MQDDQTPADSNPLVPAWDVDDQAIHAALENISVAADARERARAKLRALANAPHLELSAAVESGDVRESSVGSLAAQDAMAAQEPLPAADELQNPATLPMTTNTIVTRRRMLVVAAAASLAGLALFYLYSQPIQRPQLVAHCIAQLELISAQPPEWKPIGEDAAARLAPLMRGVNDRLSLVGYTQQSPDGLAESCRVWKFITSNGKSLYVFDFQTPRPIQDVSVRLQVITQSSSSWSLAAMQRGGQLFVAAVDGNIDTYFKSAPLA